jgi:(2S)-methylsuccinyl-CoA dehydrogenase
MLDQLDSAVADAAALVTAAGRGLAAQLESKGQLSRGKLDRRQPEAFDLSVALARVEACRAMVAYARRLGQDYESALAAVYVAWSLRELTATFDYRLAEYGLGDDALAPLRAHTPLVAKVLGTAALSELGKTLLERRTDPGGAVGRTAEHLEMGQIFARFGEERIVPVAEHIHRHDAIIPEDLIKDLADLGVFGISIPEEYGGHMLDHLTMIIATEELSRASLGAGGSVITRPEICAKALLKGGNEEQKQRWLPAIAAGEKLVSIAVTEPNAGSDVASLRVTARPVEGGYVINGEKTWCTFAGRADVMAVLARTGSADSGHKGLTLFLAEKPSFGAGEHEHHFTYEQPADLRPGGGGARGRIEGHAIPTVGYRGMHSFSVTFEDYFVPAENRIGEEGSGFYLQMQGFAGGRIQTAARAVGLMEAAFRKAVEYAAQRDVFGQPLSGFTLPQAKLVLMAARVQACRQLSYAVGVEMDEGRGAMEASLVKLLSCKEAEWVTREAMQLHGGMGYSEEYAVSRFWQDARVLSIFEGAEEVLGLYVVARQYLGGLLGEAS